jgi:hypothetical protein
MSYDEGYFRGSCPFNDGGSLSVVGGGTFLIRCNQCGTQFAVDQCGLLRPGPAPSVVNLSYRPVISQKSYALTFDAQAFEDFGDGDA